MARYVSGSSNIAFGQGLVGSVSQNTLNYLQSQIDRLAAQGPIRQNLIDKSMKVFNAISSTFAMQGADAVLQQAESMMGLDIIEPLLDLIAMQNAKPIMQGYIMDNPQIYQMYLDGKIEAYADTWVDPEPGMIGDRRQSYQQLMHGVDRPHETQASTASFYAGYQGGDKSIDIRRLSAILRTQDAVLDEIAKQEQDPTSQYGSTL